MDLTDIEKKDSQALRAQPIGYQFSSTPLRALISTPRRPVRTFLSNGFAVGGTTTYKSLNR